MIQAARMLEAVPHADVRTTSLLGERSSLTQWLSHYCAETVAVNRTLVCSLRLRQRCSANDHLLLGGTRLDGLEPKVGTCAELAAGPATLGAYDCSRFNGHDQTRSATHARAEMSNISTSALACACPDRTQWDLSESRVGRSGMRAGWRGWSRTAGLWQNDHQARSGGFATSWSTTSIFVVVTLAYAVGAGTAWVLFQAAAAAVFFPPAGITLAALLLLPARQWGWVLVAAGSTEFLVDSWQGLGPGLAAGFAVANSVEPLVGAAAVRWLQPGRLTLTRRSDAAVFLVGAAVAGPVAGATIGAAVIHWGLGRGSWWEAFGPYWAGDALAVVTLGATIIGWGHGPTWRRRDWSIGAGLLLLTAGMTVLGFWSSELTLAYLPLPILVVAAFTRRVAVVAACGFVMAFIANTFTGAGHGPWAPYLTGPDPTATVLQLYLAVGVLTSWALAVEITERDLAHATSERERVARRQLEALQQVTAGLATAATSQQIAAVLIERGVALLSRHGVVAIIDDAKGCWRSLTTPGFPPQAARRYARIPFDMASRVPITAAATTGQRLMLTAEEASGRFPDVRDSLTETGSRSLLILPLQTRGRTVGAVAFGFSDLGAFNPEVISVAQSLADLAGQALERAVLYEREYATAHQLQRALLPRIPADLPGVTARAIYRAAHTGHEVGGDWYDVFALPGVRVGFAVGDVVGHDLQAATVMAQLQPLLRAAAFTGATPVEVVQALDDASRSIDGALCTTVGYADYTPATGELRLACAGHPPPLLMTNAETRFLEGGRSQPLGITTFPREMDQIIVPHGSTLIWYSDGLIERRDSDIDRGLQLLRATAAELPAAQDADGLQTLAKALIDRLADGVEDDIVVIAVQLNDIDRGSGDPSHDA